MFESAWELVVLVSVKLRICQYVCESECGRAAFSFAHHLYIYTLPVHVHT